jgi:hypothetical protein
MRARVCRGDRPASSSGRTTSEVAPLLQISTWSGPSDPKKGGLNRVMTLLNPTELRVEPRALRFLSASLHHSMLIHFAASFYRRNDATDPLWRYGYYLDSVSNLRARAQDSCFDLIP